MISVYADGSSEGTSTGAMGYGWIIVRGNEILDAGNGGGPVGSNNIAELLGAIEGMKALKKLKNILGHFNIDVNEPVELVSDSQYVLGMATGSFNPLKNVDLAREIKALYEELGASCRWVRGHNGDPFNEKADQLAKHGKYQYSSPKVTKKQERRERKKKKDAHRKTIVRALRLK